MIIRNIDENGDWTFGKGKSSYKRNALALNQHLKTKLLEWKGDCFFDNNAGIDWKNRLDKRSQIQPLLNEIRSLILKTDGVIAIISLNYDFNSDNRRLNLNYEIKTIYSGSTESESIFI